ncbi:MoaD/ThiS family protein [Massilia sp. TS11]|uniref:MoaD/ThiS family protein n=1 Tax=Massilia sp. TS11 TaxID=2908003 RepID=UPI001ED9E420|nr:MoaD/ThiS family protein [Massilia sp. TS11]MCG2585792.1 MoaD/ThiS family protein [Massilia sp. TS11]
MPRLVFTQQLARFLPVPEQTVAALSLRGALEEAFVHTPRLRSYVLDDQAHLRENVVIFIDGQALSERVRLDQVLQAGSTVHVLQALSGG